LVGLSALRSAGFVLSFAIGDGLIHYILVHHDKGTRSGVPAIDAYTGTHHLLIGAYEYFCGSDVRDKAMHFDSSETVVELVKALYFDQVLNALSVMANSKGHSSEGVLVPLLSLSGSSLSLLDSTYESVEVWVLIVGAQGRTLRQSSIVFILAGIPSVFRG
jgi:hypothetical protein